jgi:RimJ/RimL family protein N-acetyltransferase
MVGQRNIKAASAMMHLGRTTQPEEALAMSETAKYSAQEYMHNGQRVEIRALQPDDQAALVAAVGRASSDSLYRRFFGPKRAFTEREIAYFVNVDFVNHVALVAVVEEDGKPAIIAGARYVIVQPGQAEVAFAVVDQYQGQGLGTLLMRHLVALARAAGIRQLIAEVLPDNVSMLKVFERSGLRISTRREPQVVHVTLDLA